MTLSEGQGTTTSTTLSEGQGVTTPTTLSEGQGVATSTTLSEGQGVTTSTAARLVQQQPPATGTPTQEQSQQPVEIGGANPTSGDSSNPEKPRPDDQAQAATPATLPIWTTRVVRARRPRQGPKPLNKRLLFIIGRLVEAVEDWDWLSLEDMTTSLVIQHFHNINSSLHALRSRVQSPRVAHKVKLAFNRLWNRWLTTSAAVVIPQMVDAAPVPQPSPCLICSRPAGTHGMHTAESCGCEQLADILDEGQPRPFRPTTEQRRLLCEALRAATATLPGSDQTSPEPTTRAAMRAFYVARWNTLVLRP